MTSVILFFVCSLAFAETSSDRITVKEIFGPTELKVVRKGKEEFTVRAGAEVFVGDELRTAEKQIAQLQAYDGSQWKIAPDSTLKIEARKPGQKNFFFWVFNLIQGSFWGKVSKSDSGDGFRLKVKANNASMGVRGTEYLMESNPDGTEIDVLEGTVLLGKNMEFESGTYVSIKAGENASFKNGVLSTPKPSVLNGQELVKRYRLVLAEAGPTSKQKSDHVRAAECLKSGRGWRSFDGGDLGECL